MPHSELIRPSDPAESILFLTRLPLPWAIRPRGARSAWAWPLAGAVVGLLSAAAAALAHRVGLPPGVAAGIAITAQALVTGALHEDGLADCVDGIWGGGSPERRLEIMRDSRIGSYGALALTLSVLLRWSALSTLLAAGPAWGPLLATGALSRWPMTALLWALPPARPRGLSRLVGRPETGTVVLGAGAALVIGLLAVGASAFAAALSAAAVTLLWGLLVRTKLGGQTGDTCGAAQQLTEIAVLLTLAAGLN